MSGLRSHYSRPRKSKTFGATANIQTRSFQTPDVSNFYQTPSSVSGGNVGFDDSALMSQLDFPPHELMSVTYTSHWTSTESVKNGMERKTMNYLRAVPF